MIQNETKNRSQAKLKLMIDIGIFVGFLIAMDPHSSGIPAHEWLAVSLLAVLVVHLLLNWDWIVQITRRLFGAVNVLTRVNYVLNWLLFIDVSLIMLSGLMISESLLPSLGITLPHNAAWRSLHDLSANLFLMLLGLHTALHWNWIVDNTKRYLLRPLQKPNPTKRHKDLTA